MKRDMDLVRKILLDLEKHEHGRAPSQLEIEGYSQEQIGYHVHLMDEASLLRAADVTHRQSPSPQATPISLTWEGHEFLDAARDPSRWRSALDIAREKGGALTFEILKAVLVDLARRALELGSWTSSRDTTCLACWPPVGRIVIRWKALHNHCWANT